MAGITLVQAQAKLTGWMAADDALQTSQEYSMGSRKLTRADAAEIRENITFWNNQVKSLTRGGIKIRGGTPF
jgi:hypothetical protein